MTLEQHRRERDRKQAQLVNINKKISTAQSKLSADNKKAAEAEKRAAGTKSDSTRKNKVREAQNARDSAIRRQKEISTLQGKASALEKDIHRLEEKILRDETMQRQKNEEEIKRRDKQVDAAIGHIGSTVRAHESRLSALESTPRKIAVLYLGTSPLDAGRLRVDQEAREIREAIRLSGNPDAIDFQDRWAVRQNDILQALNEVNPTIVHFSGHGAEDGSLVIEDACGRSQLVAKDALAAVVGAAAKQVRLVVFNACFSDEDYEKVLEHAEAVIGMGDSISDGAALQFARQLYSAIGFGLSLQKSFDQARAAIGFSSPEEIGTPALHVHEGMDSREIFLAAPPTNYLISNSSTQL
ncbi:MAG: CHAT domain-containing protein [Berryella intestinalis]|uniref:CHAT domain-containing protein n=1 Tax=Berryella intestinalis TaxID=1531429 RepID=UPI002A74AA1D|nr:CHAT domain-containing protein [Berryella intestinalis]MDY3129321.1 CHAT domain-containing protein [Berryella intestinalis]